jgi:TatA/E family protein of Tat protein translocase
MFGVSDVLLILVVAAVILLFGAPKLVEWAKSLGEAKKAFSDASEGKTKTKKKK